MEYFEQIDKLDDLNDLKKYKCENCEVEKDWLIYKNTQSKYGWLCFECWRILKTRLKTIHS